MTNSFTPMLISKTIAAVVALSVAIVTPLEVFWFAGGAITMLLYYKLSKD